MIWFLIVGHVALLAATILAAWKGKQQLICCLAIPPGVGFLYTSVYQANAALKLPAPDLTAADMQAGLWVSFVSYLALLAGYWLVRPPAQGNWIKDSDLNTDSLNRLGLVFLVFGILGHWLFMRAVGGFSAYLGFGDWTNSNPYKMSGYLYNLRYGILGAAALWFVSGTLGRLSRLYFSLFLASLVFLLYVGLLDTSRGETIRAILLIIGYIYFSSHRWTSSGRWLGRFAMVGLAAGAITATLILPSFRDQGRKLSASQTTMEQAWATSQHSNRAEKGGEFDSGVRIVKQINSGVLKSPGPVHFARFLWNLVPRSLVPRKHEMFEAWAGPSYVEMRIDATSYYGCAPTGWGEAYACMGWAGAVLYWTIGGILLRKVERGIGGATAAILVGAAFYLPLMQFVGIDFWVGALSLCATALPVLVVLVWFSRKPVAGGLKTRVASRRSIKAGFAG